MLINNKLLYNDDISRLFPFRILIPPTTDLRIIRP